MKIVLTHHQYKLQGGMETYLFNLLAGFQNQADELMTYVYKQVRSEPIIGKVQKSNLSWLPRTFRKHWFRQRLSHCKITEQHDLSISLMRAFNHDLIICGGTHKGFLHHMQKSPGWLDKLEIRDEQQCYDTAKCIIAHSDLLKEELIKFYHLNPEKIITVLPPLDINRYYQAAIDKLAIRNKYGIDPSKIAILFPSTGHKRKGLSVCIDALKKLPQQKFELVVAGNPPELALENIKYVGFVTEMRELYQSCDITLLPSFYEPFGLVVPESIQCGTPVIISKFVGAKDLVTENEGVVLDNISPDEIVRAIIKITENKPRIASNFAQLNKLTVDAHIHQLKEIFYEYQKTACR